MGRLIPLDDDRAREPTVVGHKVARLARAAAAGMPVLPGWVLPLEEAARAESVAERGASPAAAVLAISALQLDEGLERELEVVAGSLGGSLVVRSSSLLDGDPRWSGAFASYLAVRSYELPAAVRGCWASAFARDPRARSELLAGRAESSRIAVLIQPWQAFDGGGTAKLEPGGRVRVSATRGAPAELVGGRVDGCVATIDPAGMIDGDRDLAGLGAGVALAVASVVRDVNAATDDDAIEWGALDGTVSLLQAGRAAPGRPLRRRRPSRDRVLPPAAERIARIAAVCPGPIGDRWVLTWAVALRALPVTGPIAVGDLPAAVGEAHRLASELTAAAWNLPAEEAGAEATACLRAILGPDPTEGLVRAAELRPVDPVGSARLLGLIEGIGAALSLQGALPSPEHVWRLSPNELERAVRGGSAPTRTGPDRWEPFLFAVAEERGRTMRGRAASAGIGAGRAFRLDGRSWSSPPPRAVLVVPAAVPQLASLIWGAAGLVATTGNDGAHLFEVARSLGVPAVLGVDIGSGRDDVIAVNGDAGTVSVLHGGNDARDEVTVGASWSSFERRTG